jgi:hypothetical protein
VDEDKIDQLANQTIYNQLNISFNELESYSFIINNDGEIVSSPFKEEIGKNVTQIMKETKPLQPILGNLVSIGTTAVKLTKVALLPKSIKNKCWLRINRLAAKSELVVKVVGIY